MFQKFKPAYPAEFHQQIVELVALGKNPNHLSKEFGCHVSGNVRQVFDMGRNVRQLLFRHPLVHR